MMKMQKICTKQLAVCLVGSFLFATTLRADNANSGLMRPTAGTVYAFLLEGLILLADGEIDTWIAGYCDGIRLCKNEAELSFIRKYSAPVQQKVAPGCLKDGDRALDIHHMIGNPEIDTAVKIYLNCNPEDPPRFYSLRKTADYWFFISL